MSNDTVRRLYQNIGIKDELDVEEMNDTKAQQVKNYDFARPAKFSKEHLRTLEIIFEMFSR